MALALFDLDNTLIAGDSDHSWGEFLVAHQLVDTADYQRRNDQYYAAYQRGELDIMDYLRFAVAPLSQFPPDQLHQWHRQFMAEKIQPLRLPKADALLEQHRRAGDTLVIITSTNRFITGPIAQALGVEHLLATELAQAEDGRYTGQIIGEPCYREGKITHLQQWLAKTGHSMAGSYFYSDSINDLPLLKAVDNPVVVDPDERLREEAQQRQWPIVQLRS